MIKRTLYFGNPAYLKLKQGQLVIQLVDTGEEVTAPVEDLGVVVLDNQQITITQGALAALMDNNTAVICCDGKRHPAGQLLPYDAHHQHGKRALAQTAASKPLVKQLWRQTIQAKIRNQAALLHVIGQQHTDLLLWASKVRSGDPDNYEARASAAYWPRLWNGLIPGFTRERMGEPPNQLLNYAYALLRAATARALVGSGLLPVLGIFHRNQYNAYALADDIMEPYRPVADAMVRSLVVQTLADTDEVPVDISTEQKRQLLQLFTADVMMDGERSPLLVALGRTSASLAACYLDEADRLACPALALDSLPLPGID